MKMFLSLILVLQILLSANVFAQDVADDLVTNTQQDLMMVIGGGIGGSVIGLSTLSFYDKPSKHISNIWTGAAIGIIAGVVFVVYSSATRGHGDLTSQSDQKSFETISRRDWHEEKFSLNLTSSAVNTVPVWHQEF